MTIIIKFEMMYEHILNYLEEHDMEIMCFDETDEFLYVNFPSGLCVDFGHHGVNDRFFNGKFSQIYDANKTCVTGGPNGLVYQITDNKSNKLCELCWPNDSVSLEVRSKLDGEANFIKRHDTYKYIKHVLNFQETIDRLKKMLNDR